MSDPMNPRRIVTGLREDGSSYVARVEAVEEVDYEFLEPGSTGPRRVQKFRIWGGDHLPLELPVDGLRAPLRSEPSADETHLALRRSSPHPPKGDGFRITMYVMHPSPDGQPQPAAPHFHWHDTVDCQWLASGRIAIVMDDGGEVVMEPGDALVQHGTNHAWRVIGDEPAVLYMFMLGANRVGPTPPPDLENVATPTDAG